MPGWDIAPRRAASTRGKAPAEVDAATAAALSSGIDGPSATGCSCWMSCPERGLPCLAGPARHGTHDLACAAVLRACTSLPYLHGGRHSGRAGAL
eukprot:37588-Chlamydomonas_euryale.AAC.3